MLHLPSSRLFCTFLQDMRAVFETLPEAIQCRFTQLEDQFVDEVTMLLLEKYNDENVSDDIRVLGERHCALFASRYLLELLRGSEKNISPELTDVEKNLEAAYVRFSDQLSKRKTILILTVYAGNGHKSASQGLLAGFDQYHALDVRVVERDISVELLTMYEPTVTHTPSLYKWIFESTDTSEMASLIHGVSYSMFAKKLQEVVEEVGPDMMVATVSFYGLGHWVDRVLRKKFPAFPFYVVVTDSITIHQSWIAPGIDGYIVSNEDSKVSLIKKGIDPAHIHALGFPVHPQFYDQIDVQKERAREGVQDKEFVFLFIANTGATWSDVSFLQLFSQVFGKKARCLVVLGKNDKLFSKLQRSDLGEQVKLYGWVNDMHRLMKLSDIVVTKAGGASVMECVSLRKPMIIYKVLPGQEEGNAELVEKYQVGEVLEKEQVILDVMESYIADPKRLQKQQQHFDKVTIPHATKKIVDFFFDRLG